MNAVLKLSPHLSPEARYSIAVRWGILGMSGSGKSHTASKLVELMLTVGAQCVILDNDGSWYGLRVPGKGKGFDIPVFGGLHGDIPLEPTAGALVADLVVDNGISVILDVSTMRKGKRHQFATDFAEQLFFRKQTQAKRTPLSLVLEECDEFCPQIISKGSERMVGAFEDIGTQGRKYGIGSVWISQRPQSVNKQVLNQCEILLVHYMYGSQERKAMSEWIVHTKMDLNLVEQLTDLEVGQAYVWSPRYLKQIEKVQIDPKQTADTSATPEFGNETKSQKPLVPINLDLVREAMAATVEKVESSDPVRLQAKIRELEKQIRAPHPILTETKTVEVPVISEAQAELFGRKADELAGLGRSMIDHGQTLLKAAATLQETAQSLEVIVRQKFNQRPITVPPPQKTGGTQNFQRGQGITLALRPPEGLEGLKSGALKILDTLVARYPMTLTAAQLRQLSGYRKSGTYDQYIGALKRNELISVNGNEFMATKKAVQSRQGVETVPAEGPKALQHFMDRMKAGESKILQVIKENYPTAITTEEIMEATGYKKSGTFDQYIGTLKRNGLIESSSEGYKLVLKYA